MKDCDSRSWIGGEGLPSRDQVKEKREQRQRKWVSVRGSHRKVLCHMKFFVQYFSIHVCGFQWRQSCTYVGLLKESHVHLEKHAVLVRTTGQTLPGLSAVVFLSVGHYPYYGSPDFSIIKSFSALVFPLGFFQGYLPKNIGVYVCLIWFPLQHLSKVHCDQNITMHVAHLDLHDLLHKYP
jgi:hypothetical protein